MFPLFSPFLFCVFLSVFSLFLWGGFSLSALQISSVNDISHSPSPYLILIDCGSSGSRVHVIRHSPPSVPNGLPEISPFKSMKTKPGIGHFIHSKTLEGIDNTITPLLSFASEHIPSEFHSSTSIYLFATAGIRVILHDAEESLRKGKISQEKFDETVDSVISIFNRCREVLSLFPFSFSSESLGILPGKTEGIFGWIAANFLMGNLKENQRDSHTEGVLEMGGASLQITFSPTHEKWRDSNKLEKVPIGDSEYFVFCHSFEHFGLEESQRLFQSLFVPMFMTMGFNPCRINGTPEEHSGPIIPPLSSVSSLSPSPFPPLPPSSSLCVSMVKMLVDTKWRRWAESSLDTLMNDLRDNEFDDWGERAMKSIVDSVFFGGEFGDPHALFSEDSPFPPVPSLPCAPHSVCLLDGNSLPPITPSDHFIAIENFFYTMEYLGTLDVKGITEKSMGNPKRNLIQHILNETHSVCTEHFNVLSLKSPRESLSDLSKYCFSSTFIALLIDEFFPSEMMGKSHGNPENSPLNLRFIKNVDGIAIDWAIGAALQIVTNRWKTTGENFISMGEISLKKHSKNQQKNEL